jgi:RNA polymerase sigma factor (sigma-70 family)
VTKRPSSSPDFDPDAFEKEAVRALREIERFRIRSNVPQQDREELDYQVVEVIYLRWEEYRDYSQSRKRAFLAITLDHMIRRAKRADQGWYRKLELAASQPMPQLQIAQPNDDVDWWSDRMQAAFKTLTVNERIVVWLRYVEDWSINEIANYLNKAPGTIKSQSFTAREKLRRVFGEN